MIVDTAVRYLMTCVFLRISTYVIRQASRRGLFLIWSMAVRAPITLKIQFSFSVAFRLPSSARVTGSSARPIDVYRQDR